MVTEQLGPGEGEGGNESLAVESALCPQRHFAALNAGLQCRSQVMAQREVASHAPNVGQSAER